MGLPRRGRAGQPCGRPSEEIQVIDLPLQLDSPNPAALEAGAPTPTTVNPS